MKYAVLLLLIICTLALVADPPLWELISGTQYSMVYMANILLDGEVFTGDNDNLAAAFGVEGDSDCRSLAAWQQPNPPNYDGFWYFTIIGNDNGDDIQFKIYNTVTDEIYSNQEFISFENNDTIGSPLEPAELVFLSTADDDNEITPANSIDLNIYPNPFNPETSVSFHLNSSQLVNLTVYNLKGQKVVNLISKVLPEGRHTAIWNGIDMHNRQAGSGIYFFTLMLPKQIITQKTLLLK